MKLIFNKKVVIIIGSVIIGIFVLIFSVKYTPKYVQYLKGIKETKQKELILHERKTDELKVKGDFHKALEGYKVLAEKTKDPDKKLEAEFMQANIYSHKLDDKSKAKSMYLNIIENREKYQNPERVIGALMEMGLVYWNERKYDEASKMYKIAFDEYPDKIDYSKVAWYLGACYQMLGKDKEASEMIAESQKRR